MSQLFAGLRELCNLIIIQPEHIRGHCSSELVSGEYNCHANHTTHSALCCFFPTPPHSLPLTSKW